MDFYSARVWAREIIESAIGPGAVAVDATMGNGHDTQWLCELVGTTGRVYAFDVQQEAVEHTAERLKQAGLSDIATLFCASHERIAELVGETGEAGERFFLLGKRKNQRKPAGGDALGDEGLCSSVEEKGEGRDSVGVDAVVFNLGWLPGAEHAVTTRVESTLKAVDAALSVMREGAVMTICVYPGHDEGARERAALLEWAAALDPKRYDALYKTYLNQPKNPPCMIAIQKKR